jgi:hypothetical protein
MSVSARRPHLRTSELDLDIEHDEEFSLGELDPGERICPPRTGAGESGVLPSFIVILIALGGGWALLSHPDWLDRISAGMTAASSSVGYRAANPAEPVPAMPPPVPVVTAEPVSAPLPPPAQSEIADAPGEKASAAVSPVTTGALPSTEEPTSAPLPPPRVDPADPYQKRASAVGLHPDISRALLARLSSTDYRNAGVAIETAVAKTPDNGVFVWPRQRKPELALFQVHFVPGAAPHCRRYVVTVTKDGWSTTAPPMEKCGSRTAGRSSG